MSTSNTEIISSKKVWYVTNINGLAKPCGNDWYLGSAPFWSEAYPDISWKICIYLNGYQGGVNGSVNVSLRQMGLKGNDCVKAKFYFYAIQNNGVKMDIVRATHEFKYWTQSSNFNVSMQNLLQTDGSITIGCEVKFSLKDINLEYVKKDESAIYSKSLLSNMFENQEFMDCTVQIGDESINAHRSVLAQNSIVFRRMFEQTEMTEAQNGIVRIDDCTSECFHVMLQYFYTGIVSDDTLEVFAEDLFAVSHKYELNPLKEKCEHFMASLISLDNIYHFCRIIETFGSTILENAISKLISIDGKIIFASDEWKRLKIECVGLTQRLLEAGYA